MKVPSVKSVLVVDDEAHIVQVVSLKLTNAGYRVLPAYDGEEAFEIASREDVSLIITDFQMPYMTGIDLAKALMSDADKSRIPILILTARGHSMDQTEADLENIQAVLTKPFSPRLILQQVEALIGTPSSESPSKGAQEVA